MSKVYAIQQGHSGPIKVGYSKDPHKRLSQLQTGCIEALSLIGCMEGGAKEESSLHKLLDDWRITGEWFDPCAEVIDILREAMGELNQGFGNSTIFLNQDFLAAIATGEIHLTYTECRVLFCLVGTAKTGNIITETQAELASLIGITKQAFCTGLGALERQGVVMRSRSAATNKRITVSPYLMWKGNENQHKHAMRNWDALAAGGTVGTD